MIKVFKRLATTIIVSILLEAGLAANAIRLRVVSSQGVELKKVQVGTPCLVEVVLPGSVQLQHQLMIPGLDHAKIIRQQESTQLYVNNGVQRHEKTIGYMVRFSKPGALQLGPVRGDTAQGAVTSNSVELIVEPASEKSSEKSAAFAEWHIEKDAAYVGEGIPFSLNFYYNDESTTNVNPIPFKLPDAQLAVHEAGVGSIERRHGSSYQVLMWRGMLYPKKMGKLLLPAVTFEYLKPQEAMDTRSVWMQFMQMVGSALTQGSVQSDQKEIEVKPLPAHNGPVAGVGKVTQLAASISALQAEAGKPLVYTLTLTGDAHMQSPDAPALEVPDALKVYNSRTDQSGDSQLKWEYIVQGLRAGSWTIPPQHLTFFNPKRERYETFSTKPMIVEIFGEIRGENIASEPDLPENETSEPKPELKKEIEIPVTSNKPLVRMQLPLSWFWFFILMVIPVVMRLQMARFSRCFFAWHTYFKNYRLIKHVSKKIVKLSAYEQLKQIQYLCEKVMGDENPTSGFSKEQIEVWINSWDALTAAAFSANNKPNIEATHVIIDMLNKCVRRPSWRLN